MPIGAQELLSLLAEPLKQLSETPDTFQDYVSENLKEFQDWVCFCFHTTQIIGTDNILFTFVCMLIRVLIFKQSEYYSCDATYRNWLKIELANADVSPVELSVEEKQRAIEAAKETLNLSLLLLLSK